MKIGNSQATNESLISLNKAKDEESKVLKRIAAQRPIEATDGSSLAIADALLSQFNSMAQGVRNANDALGILQIADGALSNITDSAIRINELSVQLGNPTLNQDQRNMIQSQVNALTQSMNDAVGQASFNGKSVFSGQMDFLTGSGITSINLQAPNTSGIDVNNQDSILSFMTNVNLLRADIGAAMNGIQAGVNSNMNTLVNLKAAESGLMYDDLAQNYNDLNRATLLANASLYASSFNTNYLQSRLDALLG
ncbi:MAG: flagellin [Helicobacter sp.]|nr:flagellin [Helicobacter sp.]